MQVQVQGRRPERPEQKAYQLRFRIPRRLAIDPRRAFEELGSVRDRDAWLRLPITGCDGIPRSGQKWVRQGRLAATVVSPPLMGDALELLALNAGSQPPERTLVSPSSFPSLKELQKPRGQAAQMPSETSSAPRPERKPWIAAWVWSHRKTAGSVMRPAVRALVIHHR